MNELLAKGKAFCFSYHAQVWNLFVLDVLTKRWALHSLRYQSVVVCPYLSFELSINRGISWSMFSSSHPVVFAGVTAVVGVFLGLFAWISYTRKKPGQCLFAETLVIVGGTGNFFDRLFYGGVVDFIHVHYGEWSFPTFNVADICIVTGIFLMVFHSFFNTRHPERYESRSRT
jgi:signal peptidase II